MADNGFMTNWKKHVLNTVAATVKTATLKSAWPAVKVCADCGQPYHDKWALPDRVVNYCPAYKNI